MQVREVVQSAFDSAGQPCSALRMLCLQDDTADEVLAMLKGHMAELVIGDPTLIAIERARDLKGEVFGPVLHVSRYAAEDIDKLVDETNAFGYGLTLGIHSRILSLGDTDG